MSDLPEKAQWLPVQPFQFREKAGGRANYNIGFMRYVDGDLKDGGSVCVDWPLTVVALEDADKSDPENQLRVYIVRIGNSLAYRVTFTDVAQGQIEPDFRRFLNAVMVAIGVENADEIKAAISVEREKAAAAA